MDKKALINKFKEVLDRKKCKSSQNPEPALLCRNKERKVSKDSTWKKEEVKMLQDAIAKIENNELQAYLGDMKRKYNKNVQRLEEGKGDVETTMKYIYYIFELLDTPSFISFVTQRMINKEHIKKYRNPLQRYHVIIQKNTLMKFDNIVAKLNVLRLTLSHYKRTTEHTLETIL